VISCSHCGRQNREGGRFCTSCGAGLPGIRSPVGRLIWVDEETQEEREYAISEVERYVGRVSTNDVVIADSQVSTRHCRIVPRGEAFWLEDLGSRNGTYANGVRIEEPRKLENEDLIKIGTTLLKFNV
jgi:pSer/pThr/pTyr-binding forkhead associated (FHA) protein